MGLSHPMGLKVADLSNRRMTSFTHYRTVISPIDIGGLCTSSTKPSRGSALHTSETNYTLKGRWHTNAKDPFCKAKPLFSVRVGGGGEGRERRENLWHTSLALPLGCKMHLQGAQGRRGDKNGSMITRDCNVQDQEPAHLAYPLATISRGMVK